MIIPKVTALPLGLKIVNKRINTGLILYLATNEAITPPANQI